MMPDMGLDLSLLIAIYMWLDKSKEDILLGMTLPE